MMKPLKALFWAVGTAIASTAIGLASMDTISWPIAKGISAICSKFYGWGEHSQNWYKYARFWISLYLAAIPASLGFWHIKGVLKHEVKTRLGHVGSLIILSPIWLIGLPLVVALISIVLNREKFYADWWLFLRLSMAPGGAISCALGTAFFIIVGIMLIIIVLQEEAVPRMSTTPTRGHLPRPKAKTSSLFDD